MTKNYVPIHRPPSPPPRAAPSLTYSAACAALRAQATNTAAAIIETRTHRFALAPRQLDALEPGLSKLTPEHLRQRIAELIEEERTTPRRRMGMGGDVPMINLRAAARYAQQLCGTEVKQAHDDHGRFALRTQR